MRKLTEEAEAEYLDFSLHYDTYGCQCHINLPCGSCTHPGNPFNQAQDDYCWVQVDNTTTDLWERHQSFF